MCVCIYIHIYVYIALTLHSDTTMAATHAKRKARTRPMTPSALISPRPVLHAPSTAVDPGPIRTRSCTSFIDKSALSARWRRTHTAHMS